MIQLPYTRVFAACNCFFSVRLVFHEVFCKVLLQIITWLHNVICGYKNKKSQYFEYFPSIYFCKIPASKKASVLNSTYVNYNVHKLRVN